MVNATFAYQKTEGVNNWADVAFTVFAQIYSLVFFQFCNIFAGNDFVQIHFFVQ